MISEQNRIEFEEILSRRPACDCPKCKFRKRLLQDSDQLIFSEDILNVMIWGLDGTLREEISKLTVVTDTLRLHTTEYSVDELIEIEMKRFNRSREEIQD